jgi:hypothetical protein
MNRLLKDRTTRINALQEDLIRRMGEPEPYRTLRLQKERIEAQRQQELERMMYDKQAEDLRKEIKKLGHVPAA